MKNFDFYTRKSAGLLALLTLTLFAGCGGGKWNSDPQTDVVAPVVPTVTTWNPGAEATNVAVTTAVTATFSTAMAEASINDASFTLVGPENAEVAGTVSYAAANMTAAFLPDGDLARNTTYTAAITTDVLSDAGEALALEHSWTFTTQAPVALSVPSSNPVPGATNVSVTSAVSVTFDTAMAETSINDDSFTLTGPDNTAVAGTVSYSVANKTAAFLPDSDLARNTTYTAAITTDVLSDAGEALALGHSWTFTTEAPVAPSVTRSRPAPGATGVAVTSAVSVTFKTAMAETSINDESVTLTGPDNTVVEGAVSYSAANRTATFTPTNDLAVNTLYTAAVTTDALTEAGVALASEHSWAFTTAVDAMLPVFITVTETNPVQASSNVCTNKSVSATFSEQMEATTLIAPALSFTLAEAMNDIDGEVSLDASGKTATFTPTEPLNSNVEYMATITTSAKDDKGNALETDVVWTFTTGDSFCQQTITLAGIEPYGVLSNTGMTLGGGPDSTTGLRVDGNVGIFPAGACSGCDSTTVSGLITIGTDPAQDAMVALEAAYNEAVNRATSVCTLIDSGVLATNPSAACGGGADGIFPPGLYWSGTSIAIPAGGTITLDGGNDNNAVFIFQSASTIDTIGGNTHMILINGAQAKNVFWVAGSSATIGGVDSDFSGTVLALIGITVNTGTEMTGRALARGAAVVVQDGALITVPTE